MSQHLAAEVQKALHLLNSLTKHEPPEKPLGELNPKHIKECKGVFFYHTTKVGLGVSVKWGSGLLLIRRPSGQSTQEDSWSAPAFYRVQCASVGVSAGVSTVQTLLILGTSAAVESFKLRAEGNGGLVLGQDVKIAAMSDLGWGAVENGGGSLDGGLLHPDTVALSADISGVMLDWSIVGGTVRVDAAVNEHLYGPSATAKSILEGQGAAHLPPQECNLLYEALSEIAEAADADPRKFPGFVKKWKPHALLATSAELQKLD